MKKTSFVLALLPACLGLVACAVSNTPNPVRYTLTPSAPTSMAAIPIQVAQKLCGKKIKNVEKVSVFIDRLDGTLDGKVLISAQIVVSRLTETEIKSESFLFSKNISAGTIDEVIYDISEDPYATYAQAISAAVAALAQAIADNLCE